MVKSFHKKAEKCNIENAPLDTGRSFAGNSIGLELTDRIARTNAP
jgi:hypothetical protein